jgi:alpha-tubulin suppressor-like RCC1 family protein
VQSLGIRCCVLFGLLFSTHVSAVTPLVAAGIGHAVALKSNGTMVAWGSNNYGQLGEGTASWINNPMPVVQGASGVVSAVTAGSYHTLALESGGTVLAWGLNASGQLGIGTTTQGNSPAAVPGLSGVMAVGAGAAHSLAINADGTVLAWGSNTNGQLGDGTTTQSNSPVTVQGLSGAIAVKAGAAHSVALKSNGTMVAWGSNSYGQLGDGTTTQRNIQTLVQGISGISGVSGVSGVIAAATGDYHTMALKADGTVMSWGSNDSGQLGDGTTTQRANPVQVSGLGGVIAIAAGSNYSLALKSDGTVWSWGAGAALGDASVAQRNSPAQIPGLSGVVAVAAGSSFACALTSSGAVQCWGNNSTGQLGDGTVLSRAPPVLVSGIALLDNLVSQDLSFNAAPTVTVGGTGVVSANATSGLAVNFSTLTYNICRVLGSSVTGITAGTCIIAANQPGNSTYSQAPQLTQSVSIVAGSQMVAPMVAVGNSHACSLTSSGGVKCWGSNAYGQLGDGGNMQQLAPVDVRGLNFGVIAIATGSSHSCALTSDGGVKCWGLNSYGQLGDNSTSNRMMPVAVTGLASGVIAIAAGNSHTCALTRSGGMKCWGYNNVGQLGNGSNTQSLIPVFVTGLASGVSAIAAGSNHNCALNSSGAMKCWGNNIYGQLGDNTQVNKLTPVDVAGLTSGVSAIAAGPQHTCALTGNGSVKCWGYNNYGQLGDNSTTNRLTPVDVTGLAGVSAIAAGAYHNCALTSGGGVKCWGYNVSGQLGDGSTTTQLTSVDAVSFNSGVNAIAAGGNSTCVLSNGLVKCWGYNTSGQLGSGSYDAVRLTPVGVNGLGSGASRIAAGSTNSCALTSAGTVKCWGVNSSGQLGDGSTTNRSAPVDVTGLVSGISAIATGSGHSCALTSGGGVKCWGSNSYGQVGDNSNTNRLAPVDVIGLTSGVIAIVTGSQHSCVLTSSGGVKCWGYNGQGQLGNGYTLNSTTSTYAWPSPSDVSGLTSGVIGITAGTNHTCALLGSGLLRCWGSNTNGQLGDGTTNTALTPVNSSLTSGVIAISAGSSHSCALTSGNGVKCWGYNNFGQLGNNTIIQSLAPVDVSGLASGVSAISAGGFHTCALTNGGAVECWGENSYGQLGDGSATQKSIPVSVTGLASGVIAIATGGEHSCALTGSNGVKCWGYNSYGQIGDGTAGYRMLALPATGLSVFDNPTTLAESQNSSALGQNVTYTATVKGISPTGTVSFNFGDGTAVVALSGGSATAVHAFNNAGSYAVFASYSGDANNTGGSTATVLQTVNLNKPSVSVPHRL